MGEGVLHCMRVRGNGKGVLLALVLGTRTRTLDSRTRIPSIRTRPRRRTRILDIRTHTRHRTLGIRTCTRTRTLGIVARAYEIVWLSACMRREPMRS